MLTNTSGSHGFTPNSKLAMNRVKPNADATPTTTPTSASRIP